MVGLVGDRASALKSVGSIKCILHGMHGRLAIGVPVSSFVRACGMPLDSD
jgi:hypothetical protein